MQLAKAYITTPEHKLTLPVNPYSADWGYQENTNSTDTLGGRVVQILSAQVTDLNITTVAGSRNELQRMAEGVRQIMEYHVKTLRPAIFKVPSRAWAFKVYLQAMPQVGWDVSATSYPYSLTMKIDEDLTGVKQRQITQEAINRLVDGIGYNKAVHGGDPAAFDAIVKSVLGATNGPLSNSNTSGGNGGGGPGGAPGSSGVPNKGTLSAEDLARLAAWALAKKIPQLTHNDLVKNTIFAVAVALCESGGNVGSNNPNAANGTAIGLWQATAGQNGYSAQTLATAEGNATWMAIELNVDYTLSISGNPYPLRTWEHAWWCYWGCFRGQGSGYQSHLSVARAAVQKVL